MPIGDTTGEDLFEDASMDFLGIEHIDEADLTSVGVFSGASIFSGSGTFPVNLSGKL